MKARYHAIQLMSAYDCNIHVQTLVSISLTFMWITSPLKINLWLFGHLVTILLVVDRIVPQ